MDNQSSSRPAVVPQKHTVYLNTRSDGRESTLRVSRKEGSPDPVASAMPGFDGFFLREDRHDLAHA